VAAKKAGFRSLGDAWADTITPHGRLMLTVPGGLAEFERDLVRARAGEGPEQARRAGSIWAGRRRSRSSSRKKHGGGGRRETVKELAMSYNVGRSTISRL